MLGFSLVMIRVCAIHVNPIGEHDIEDVDGSYASCCSIMVSILLEDMESGANALHDFGALFFWDVRLGQDHGVLVFLMIRRSWCL
jgi:hypothetical protein